MQDVQKSDGDYRMNHHDVERSEEVLIVTARNAMSDCNWTVGECASNWTKKYARGRTDADFGHLLGLSGDQVYMRRRVWETFHSFRNVPEHDWLKWSHFYVALNWEDATTALKWANDCEATVAEMRAWRRAQNGLDLFAEPEESYSEWAAPICFKTTEIPPISDAELPEDREPVAKPVTVPTPKAERKREAKAKPVAVTTVETTALEPAEPPFSVRDWIAAINKSVALIKDSQDRRDIAVQYRKAADKLDPPTEKARFRPPTVADVLVYCEERKNKIDADKFVDFYTSKNWVVGKAKMKDWKAAVRNAEKNDWCDRPTQTTSMDFSEYD